MGDFRAFLACADRVAIGRMYAPALWSRSNWLSRFASAPTISRIRYGPIEFPSLGRYRAPLLMGEPFSGSIGDREPTTQSSLKQRFQNFRVSTNSSAGSRASGVQWLSVGRA